MEREERIKVFEETLECSKRNSYINEKGETVNIYREDYGMNFDEPTIFNKNLYPKIKDIRFDKNQETEIVVENIDCLYAACNLVDEGYNPAVLNMASFSTPGGGVAKGSAAQEESLCRRTNLYLSISRFAKQDQKVRYPLDINYGAIYSPVVSVFRLSEKDGCKFMDTPVTIDVISAAAIKKPILENGHMTETNRMKLRNKIRTILNLGIYFRNDSLVLGAFGCGAYATPPDDVAEIFRDVLSERFYKNAFKKIVFAIIDDGNAHREHNPEGNLIPFKRVF